MAEELNIKFQEKTKPPKLGAMIIKKLQLFTECPSNDDEQCNDKDQQEDKTLEPKIKESLKILSFNPIDKSCSISQMNEFYFLSNAIGDRHGNNYDTTKKQAKTMINYALNFCEWILAAFSEYRYKNK